VTSNSLKILKQNGNSGGKISYFLLTEFGCKNFTENEPRPRGLHMANFDKQTYFLSLNFTHDDSTTRNFTFSFYVSSLSNGYHPAPWFNTQAKANLIRNKHMVTVN
jgi:hypothetical protein